MQDLPKHVFYLFSKYLSLSPPLSSCIHSFLSPNILSSMCPPCLSPSFPPSHPPGIWSRKLERFSAVMEPERGGGGWERECVRESSERRDSREEPGEPLSLKEHMELTDRVTISGPPCSLCRLSEREHCNTPAKVTGPLTNGRGWRERRDGTFKTTDWRAKRMSWREMGNSTFETPVNEGRNGGVEGKYWIIPLKHTYGWGREGSCQGDVEGK